MPKATIHPRLVLAAAVFLYLPGSPLAAQGRVEVGVRGSYLPLYSGDVTVGPTHGWGVTAEVAVTVDSLGAMEVSGFYTLMPRGDDRYNRTPRIQLAGAMVSLSRGIESHFTVVGMIGGGVIQYSPHTRGLCEPPVCFAEGGGGYAQARHATFIGGLGVEGAVVPRVRVRLDVKEHVPVGAGDARAGTAERRTDIGLGVRFLVR